MLYCTAYVIEVTVSRSFPHNIAKCNYSTLSKLNKIHQLTYFLFWQNLNVRFTPQSHS